MKDLFGRFDWLQWARGFSFRKSRTVMLSFGLAIYFSWLFLVVFSGVSFSLPWNAAEEIFAFQNGSPGVLPLIFLCVQAVVLVFMASTDQVLLRLYSSRAMLAAACTAAALGSLLIVSVRESSSLSFMGCTAVYSFVGAASAFLLMFWGVAYSRQGLWVIFACAVISICGAFGVSALLFVLPEMFRMLLFVVFPLISLFFLWGSTPESYIVRRAIPIFNPLSVNSLFFSARLVASLFFLGVAFAVFFVAAIVRCSFAQSAVEMAFSVIMAMFVVALISLFVLFAVSGFFWNSFFRVSVVFAAICSLFVFSDNAGSWFFVLALSCCMVLLSVAWIFCGYVAQNFRISPILLFGASFAGLLLGFAAGFLLFDPAGLLSTGESCSDFAETCVILASLLFAESLLPCSSEIKKAICSYGLTMAAKESRLGLWSPAGFGYANAEGNDEEVADGESCVVFDEAMASGGSEVSSAADEVAKFDDDPIGLNQDGSERLAGRFYLRCEKIANEHLLSSRETEILFLLAKGYSTKRITEEMFISKNTAKTHITHIYRKLRIHSRQELQEMVDCPREF